MLPLAEAYVELSSRLNFDQRVCIEKALASFDSEPNRNPTFLQFPTGYGKTSVTLALLLASHKGNTIVGERVIHVLPLRSIVQDISKRIKSDLDKIGMPPSLVAAQSMGSPGSPFFAKPLVITTLDTFSLNLFKLPAVEVRKHFRFATSHFEVPRGFVYAGSVVFDEAHLFTLTSSAKPLTVLLASLEQLVVAGVPIILMTATLPRAIRELLCAKLRNRDADPVVHSYSQGDDPKFEATFGKRHIVTSIIDEKDLIPTIRKLALEPSKKILVVVNEVRRAIELSQSSDIKPLSPDLIHGGLVELEKEKKIKDLLYGPISKVIISTQVIEAGVDLQNITTLITDLAPMDRLVQRAGRVARRGGDGEVIVVIRNEDLDGNGRVYDPTLLKETKRIICEQGSLVDWTLDAQNLVDKAYSGLNAEDMIDTPLYFTLTDIDENVTLGASDTLEVLKKIGSFVRDTALVKAYAPTYTTDTNVNPNGFTAVDGDVARKILLGTRKVVRHMSIVPLPKEHEYLLYKDPPLFALHLESAGYDGILLDNYEPWVGRRTGCE